MNTKLSCIIVDDELSARQGLQEYVEEIEFLHLVGLAENPIEATSLIQENNVDIMFLDIQMPFMSGIDFLKVNPNLPSAILTTAYEQYALESYELNVIDYLLKPISFERFLKASEKAKEILQQKDLKQNKYFYVKSDKKFEKINFDEILFIESLQNYIVIHTIQKKVITLLTLKEIERFLTTKNFVQVHKSYIIAIDKVESFTSEELQISNQTVPIGRTYADFFFTEIVSKNLLRK